MVRNGDLAFKVYTVTCGVTQFGSGDFGTTAPPGSQWCVANIGVVNTATGPQLFSASDPFTIDTSGQRLSADAGAMLYMATDKIDATLNPGVATAFRIPFELSKSARITSFVLHSATFSDGVIVEEQAVGALNAVQTVGGRVAWFVPVVRLQVRHPVRVGIAGGHQRVAERLVNADHRGAPLHGMLGLFHGPQRV